MADEDGSAKPWSVALAVGLAVALVETGLVATLYRDLGLADRGRYLLFYGAGTAAVWSLVPGLLAALGAALAPSGRARLGLAAGAAAGAFLLLFARIALTLEFAGLSLLGGPALAGGAGAALGAMAFGIVAYLLAPTTLGRLPLPGAGTVVLLAVAAAAFALRAPGTTPAAPVQPGAQDRVSGVLDPDRTNVFFLTIDTLRADHMEAYDYPRETAPELAELAERGVLFERAIAQRTNTSPSLATLLTGTYPPTHRVLDNGQFLQEFNLTLAEMLKPKGFHTRAIISNPTLTQNYNFNQGFDTYQHTPTLNKVLKEELLESRHLNQLVLPALDELRSEHFFFWVHYRDPHTPYLVPEEYKDLFTNDALAKRHGGRIIPIGEGGKGSMAANEAVYGSQNLDFLIAQYDAEIRFNDDSVGQVFEKMREHGLWEDTLFVFTADHGELLWEHDYFFTHGSTTYEPTAHVPLFFYHPKLPSGLRVSQPVSLVDVLPTVLDLLDLPTPPTLQGESFAELLMGRKQDDFRNEHYVLGDHRFGYQTHALTTDSHKLIFDANEWWAALDATVELVGRLWVPDEAFQVYRFRSIDRELYDLRADPEEERNLAGTRPEFEERHAASLWRWIEASYGASGVTNGGVKPEVSEDVQEALRALGYIDQAD